LPTNSTLRISELDFDTIKRNLTDFLRAQSEFTDYDFEGSGLSVLLDLLAYNTHFMAYYLNMVGNEMFLDTAQLRQSILSHAKLTNYVPESTKAATAVVNIRVTPSTGEDQDASTLTLNKYTTFLSEAIDGTNYPFVSANTIQTIKTSGSFLFSNVTLKQGEVVTHNYIRDVDNLKARFLIPSEKIDTDTLEVHVQESTTNSAITRYTVADDITEVTANSTVYFLEENPEANGTYTMYFGDGIIGKTPDFGNIIICTWIDTEGSPANKANLFTATQAIDNFSDNIAITTVATAAGGAPKETIDEIRFRAPYFYTAQNRMVNFNDYKNLLPKDYPIIDSLSIWGGENNDPPVYGKVFISIKPKQGYFLTTPEKQRIITELIANRSVLTVIPEIIDPEYVFLVFETFVDYDPLLTAHDEDALKSIVRATILDYEATFLNKFDGVYRQSKLHKLIDESDPSFLSNTLKVSVQKRLKVTTGVAQDYIIHFNTPLNNGGFFNKITTFPTFNIADHTGVERESYIEEITESITGVSSIEIVTSGSNYTEAPRVVITGDGQGAEAEAHIVNGRVHEIEITNPGSGYSVAAVSIEGGGGSGAIARAFLEAKQATLQVYYYKSNGEKVVIDENIGTIFYDRGVISLTAFAPISVSLNDHYEEDTIAFNCRPATDHVVHPIRNMILDIDDLDATSIVVHMNPEGAAGTATIGNSSTPHGH
jgi:hypothetical protein